MHIRTRIIYIHRLYIYIVVIGESKKRANNHRMLCFRYIMLCLAARATVCIHCEFTKIERNYVNRNLVQLRKIAYLLHIFKEFR